MRAVLDRPARSWHDFTMTSTGCASCTTSAELSFTHLYPADNPTLAPVTEAA
ncbi:hypothetical protein HD597_000281 [Nonomuraea thailandensis]|uniref:Uncharacterized protein n=1 Tax=Nonomuraea thailandensis TaxID=1188745 RepID=A0A9X2K188_9ACTN|nr:hypothetical protein [Nonomuraea thailandensis]MCP2353261.1 hypothetical protein [Nonomuraea thailandensis]